MARKKIVVSESEPKRPPQHPALEAMNAVFDALPKGKFTTVFREASLMETCLRRGLAGLQLLVGIRKYILETPDLGGEESPFVKKIDELLPREQPTPEQGS